MALLCYWYQFYYQYHRHPNQYLPKIEEAPLKPETDLSVFGEKKEEEKPSYEQPHEPEHKPEPEHKQ